MTTYIMIMQICAASSNQTKKFPQSLAIYVAERELMVSLT